MNSKEIANKLLIKYNVVSNIQIDGKFIFEIQIENSSAGQDRLLIVIFV